MYLIDTIVLSELRRRQRHAGIVRWLRGKAVDALFLSVITIGEIEGGVLRQQVENPAFAEALRAWLEHGLTVVTRNVRYFLPTGVPVEDPFEDLV